MLRCLEPGLQAHLFAGQAADTAPPGPSGPTGLSGPSGSTHPWPADVDDSAPAPLVERSGTPSRKLVEALEDNERTAYRSFFEVGTSLFGGSAFQVLEAADGGGVTGFVSPLVRRPGVFNRVLSLGVRSALQPADLTEWADRFRRAGVVPAFELVPGLFDDGTSQSLRSQRMRRAATSVVVHCRLDADDHHDAPRRAACHRGVRVVAARGAQCRVAATICAEVFGMPPAVLSLLEALQDQPGWQHWLALLEGQPAGAAMTFMHGGQGWFGWAATLPALRSRGVKGALDEARLAAVRAAGCRFVSSDASMGTHAAPDHSLLSLLRHGFRAAYVRASHLRSA